MATNVYQSKNINLINGTEIEIIPLKIKYLREFMEAFEYVKSSKNDDEAIDFLVECVRISMKQFYPEISKNKSDIEDNFDMPTIYTILDISAGIKINQKSEETVKDQATDSGSTWSDLDLAKIESEVFLLGIWKDYKELETSLSMPELMATLASRRELDYEEKKFLAAIQGVDLDKESGSSKGQQEWEDMKARVFSRGATNDSKDILAFKVKMQRKQGLELEWVLIMKTLENSVSML
jgi:hypothetical protein